jgi:hypothetical protein
LLTLLHEKTDGILPTSTYQIAVDGVVVGTIQLRHKPGKSEIMPEGFESHVYYNIERQY